MKKETMISLIGAGGHSRVIGSMISGVYCIGKYYEGKFQISECLSGVVIAIGDNYSRRQVSIKLDESNVPYETIIHPSAVIARGVQIGAGTVIMANAVVNSGCKIGKHCIVNTGAILEHDSIMEDFSSLGPRVVTGGMVSIKSGTAVGIGATISNGVTIEHNTVIGAGSVVVKDIPFGVVAYGNPCKVIRPRTESEPYLK